MKSLRCFTLHGTAVDCDQNIKLDEISVLADPGTIRVLGVFLMGPARVLFGKDPADTWSDGSYIGKPEWPLNPPGPEEVPSQVQAMVAKVLPSKSWDMLEKGKDMAQTGNRENST